MYILPLEIQLEILSELVPFKHSGWRIKNKAGGIRPIHNVPGPYIAR